MVLLLCVSEKMFSQGSIFSPSSLITLHTVFNNVIVSRSSLSLGLFVVVTTGSCFILLFLLLILNKNNHRYLPGAFLSNDTHFDSNWG